MLFSRLGLLDFYKCDLKVKLLVFHLMCIVEVCLNSP